MTLKSKVLIAAPAAIAFALSASCAAAHDDAAAPTGTDAVKTSAAPARVVMTTAAALVAVRDPETGELRAPTAEEAQALTGSIRFSSFARSAVAAPRVFATPGGARGLTLGEDTFGFSVARKDGRGKVVEECVTGAVAASEFLAGKPAKELPNE